MWSPEFGSSSDDEYSIYDNPFKKASAEHRYYNNILKAIDFYKTQHDGEFIDEDLLFGEWKTPRRAASNAFTKHLINNFDFNFSVSLYEEAIADKLLVAANQQPYERFDKFFELSIPTLETFHKLYLNHISNDEPLRNSIESIKKVLLYEASVERKQNEPLTMKQLLINVNNRLLDIPRVMTNKEMYEDYKSHLPKKVVKTKTIIKKPTTFIQQKETTFKLSPWTTPNKASDFMKRNEWSVNEIEDWNYNRKSDFFDYKKQSKQYMLRTVAPRYSFIIDYFFPGKFVYLLAININTRKAYAIPSPEIKEINTGRFSISDKNHKTATTSIKLLNELFKQTKTKIKHIMCDQEAAFLSKMFKDECKKKRIELIHYIKNNVKGIVETTEASRGNHTTLSIIDRLCRTLRRMNYNLGYDKDINPNTMKQLINEYNNSPHKTLSDIVGRPTTLIWLIMINDLRILSYGHA